MWRAVPTPPPSSASCFWSRSTRSGAAIRSSTRRSSPTRSSAAWSTTSGPAPSRREPSASAWSASRSRALTSDDPGIVALPVPLPQEPLVELAVVVAREVVDEVDRARALVGCELTPAERQQLVLQRSPRLRSVDGLQDPLPGLAHVGVGPAADRDVDHRRL